MIAIDILAERPIEKHYLGMPCMFGESVGRIVGAKEDCQWADTEYGLVPSQPIFSTPHGTEVVGGRFYFDKINKEGLERLKKFEAQAREENGEIYNGKLTEKQLKWKQ